MSDTGKTDPPPAEEPPLSPRSRCDAIYRECGSFVWSLLARRGDIQPASREDLHQLVHLALLTFLQSGEPIRNVKGKLVFLLRNELTTRRRLWKEPIDDGASAEDVGSDDLGPERILELVDRWRRLGEHMERLDPDERDLIEHVDMEGKSFADLAREREMPVTTLKSRHARALAKLARMAEEDERADEERNG
jgi:RNA polymerase sigma factor (sigma-70 family)